MFLMTDTLRVKKAPLLSFCIPTYNRAEILLSLVLRLLKTSSDEIEVVILDNYSSDNTLSQLATIDDPRLVVISSKTNRGALFNQVNVLLQGRGVYSVLLLDKDSVDPALIPAFLDFLVRESPSTGYCEYNKPVKTPPQIFQIGAAALCGVAYSCHHPTGYFFHTADLHEINILGRFTDSDHVGNFPFEFMQAELCLRGPGAIFQEPVFSPESLEAAQAIKSFSINASKENAFFSPEGRLKLAINFTNHIQSLPIPPSIKRQLILDRFAHGLFAATFGYRAVLCNTIICSHYHITTRRVGMLELVGIASKFYRLFCRANSDGLVGKDIRLSHTGIAVSFLGRLFNGISRRIIQNFT